MTAREWNTFQACELEEIGAAAYEAGDYENAYRCFLRAANRWVAVR